MNYKNGDKVKIIYNELEKDYAKTIQELLKSNPFFNKTVADMVFKNELKEMKKFDLKNGVIRKIKSIVYKDYLDKKIARITLDNEFVYYENELIKIGGK